MALKFGIVLILASFVPWMLLPLAAWLPPTPAAKAAWSAGLIVLGEALFWPGLLLAGREVWISAKKLGFKNGLLELLRRLR